jgi:hypothetical protein
MVVNHIVDLLLNKRADVIENSLLLLSHQSIIIQKSKYEAKSSLSLSENIMTCLLGFFLAREADLLIYLVPLILFLSFNTLLGFAGEPDSYKFIFPSFCL